MLAQVVERYKGDQRKRRSFTTRRPWTVWKTHLIETIGQRFSGLIQQGAGTLIFPPALDKVNLIHFPENQHDYFDLNKRFDLGQPDMVGYRGFGKDNEK